MDANSIHRLRTDIGLAASAVLVAATIPLSAAPAAPAAEVVSLSSAVVLTSDVVDGIAPAAAEIFDIVGLFNAELAEAQSIFSTIIGFPGAVWGDLYGGITAAFNDLLAFDFGNAFSAVTHMAESIFFDVINLPLNVGRDVYEMLLVIPGEFLLNFT